MIAGDIGGRAPQGILFVIGSPRSGTSIVARILAAHPEIAGAPGESHLFDQGVNALFDNFEASEPWQTFLSSHVSRAQLVELARQLCDGVFDAVRARENPDARYVIEKTPYGQVGTDVQLDRKLECYPDGLFLHLIRDGRAVVRSLRHTPWGSDETGEAATAQAVMNWRRAIEVSRDRLAGSPRYVELRYEDLVADPPAAMRAVFEWLGVRADADTDALVGNVMKHRVASSEAKLRVDPDEWRNELTSADLRIIEREAGDLLQELGYDDGGYAAAKSAPAPSSTSRGSGVGQKLRSQWRARRVDPGASSHSLVTAFAKAISERDADGLRALLTDDVHVDVRTPDVRLQADGDRAIACLLNVADVAFGERLVGQSWATFGGDPLSSLWFAGTRASGEPIDLAFSFLPRGDQLAAVALLSPAPGGALDDPT